MGGLIWLVTFQTLSDRKNAKSAIKESQICPKSEVGFGLGFCSLTEASQSLSVTKVTDGS